MYEDQIKNMEKPRESPYGQKLKTSCYNTGKRSRPPWENRSKSDFIGNQAAAGMA
jgi:hypothetical protein